MPARCKTLSGAVRCDLYDNLKVIPFDRIEAFYNKYLC